ncbi:MAG: hypothetical protein IT368_08765 [Candidatus Hydrogenedentes bacterium]|nr:hypothetical protein [Candidatus Hydrogenedentota bacterium]
MRVESRQPDLGVDEANPPEGRPATGQDSQIDSAEVCREDSRGAAAQEPTGVSPGSSAATADTTAAAASDAGNAGEPAQDTTPAVVSDGSLPDEPLAAEPPPTEASQQTWLLATNHQNMAYMLTTGLLTGPAGFGGKYYRDASGDFPGWLPVFRGAVPAEAIRSAVSEGKTLQPCIAEVDIGVLRGAVRWFARDGALTGEVTLPGVIDVEVGALLLPTPMPADAVKRLWFGSEEARRAFERVAATDPTIALDGLSLQFTWPPSAAPSPIAWPPAAAKEEAAAADSPPARGQAIGGVLAMLYHLANRSDLLGAVYRIAAGERRPGDAAIIQRDPVLKELPEWLAGGGLSKDAAETARLYWGAADALVQARLIGPTPNAIDAVLGYLESPQAYAAAPTRQSSLSKLTIAMRDAFGMSKGTNTELLRSHPGSLSRPLLLLCLRERCIDLLEFANPELKDEEVALAAILFGIRDGWRKLPKELRLPEPLARHVIGRMFEVEQWQRGSSALALSSPPPRPKTLRELIQDDGTWTGPRQAAFVKFAGKHKWDECVVTRITLPEGSYQLTISQKRLDLTFASSLVAARNEVNKVGILARIAQWPPRPREIDDELRDLLVSEGT